MVGLFRSSLGYSISVYAALLLNACAFTNVNPRPEDWAPAETIPAAADCPDISGVYKDVAENCEGSKCHLLNVFQFRTDYPLADFVEITLLSDDTLKLVGHWSGVKAELMLSRRDGDFRCGSEGLIVTSREDSYFWVVSFGSITETRAFNRCSDGSLVMKVEQGGLGIHGLTPYGIHAVGWARWEDHFSP